MKENNEPFHKVGRQSAIICVPTTDTILDQSFDYGQYVEDYFKDTLEARKGNYQGYFEGLEDVDSAEFLNNLPNQQKVDNKQNSKLKEIEDNYHKKIYALQNQYERAYQTGHADKINEEITRAMQIITSDYLTQIDTVKDTKELDELSQIQEQKVKEIDDVQNKSIEYNELRKQQLRKQNHIESMERIKAYKEGKLKLTELKPCDVRYMDSYYQIDNKIALAARKLVKEANIPNSDDYTLGELYSMIPGGTTPKPSDGSKTI